MQGPHHTEAKHEHDDAKRQGRYQRHGLQRLEPASIEHSNGDECQEHAPEGILPFRGIRIVTRGDAVHNEYARIGRSNEEDGNHQDGQHTQGGCQWKLFEETE